MNTKTKVAEPKTEEAVSYGYYSKILNKPFDTIAELKAAEEEYNKAHALELKAKEEKKAAADKVSAAYKAYLDVCEKANKEIQAAKAAYFKERDAFISTYGSYHMTYTRNGSTEDLTIGDIFNDAFRNFWNRF